MTVQLSAFVKIATPLSEVIAHVERSISRFVPTPHMAPIVAEGAGPATEIVIGPFPVHPVGPRPRPISSWERPDLCVSAGPGTLVGLGLIHWLTDAEAGIDVSRYTEAQRQENAAWAGYRAQIDIGYGRTRTSFTLGAFLAHSIATLNHSLIYDDEGHFQRGEYVEPEFVAALFANHAGAPSFAEFSARMCRAIGVGFGGER